MGKVIVIEGLDGSGKQTQTEKLYNRLMDSNDELGVSNLKGNRRKSSAIKVYIEYLEEKKNH